MCKGRPRKQPAPTIDLTEGDVRVLRAERETTWTGLRYYQTDEVWQREKCAQLSLRFHNTNNFQLGGPNVFFNRPNTERILRARGDGNCFFRCFSQIITGSPDQHYEVRMCIIKHMQHIAHLLIASTVSEVGDDIEAYISTQKNGLIG